MDVYFQKRFPGRMLLFDGERLLTFWQKFQGRRLFQCGRHLIFQITLGGLISGQICYLKFGCSEKVKDAAKMGPKWFS